MKSCITLTQEGRLTRKSFLVRPTISDLSTWWTTRFILVLADLFKYWSVSLWKVGLVTVVCASEKWSAIVKSLTGPLSFYGSDYLKFLTHIEFMCATFVVLSVSPIFATTHSN